MVRVHLGAVLLLLITACTGAEEPAVEPTPSGTVAAPRSTASAPAGPQQQIGPAESALNLVAWPGYVEDGTNDQTADWVTPFEDRTGCEVTVTVASSAEEMVALMRTDRYDGVSAPGEATLRMVGSGDVAPVNTDLVPNYQTVSTFLKNRVWNSVADQMYGIPHGWGVNLLLSRSDLITPAPDSWSVVFDPQSPHRGKVTAYDSPISIAEAALYLRTARPELGITDPYRLDRAQFTAAVDLSRQQRDLIGEYWSEYTEEIQAFERGDAVVGAGWQVIGALIDSGGKAKVNAISPIEGSTGWSDTWMLSSRAPHPNCMYRWLDWIISPEINAQAAEWFGQAPAQTLACAETVDEKHCETYQATDAAAAAKIAYRTTPTQDCGDSRGQVCIDYPEWITAWEELRN